MSIDRQMPRYKSHKTVWALQIKEVQQPPADELSSPPGGTYRLIPVDALFGPITVSHEYVAKHKPEVGGYFVQYADGYLSYSPQKAFEEGNTRIDSEANYDAEPAPAAGSSLAPHQQRVLQEKTDLDDRLSKLDSFLLDNPLYLTLPEAEQKRLTQQARVMGSYSDILGQRIAAFQPAPK